MPALPPAAAANPLPSAGFTDAPLVLTEFTGGALTRLVRTHHPDPLGVRPAPSRFSDPRLGAAGHAPFAVLYLGTTFRVSFVETVLRDAGDGRLGALPLEEAELAAWSCAAVATRRPLRLVDLTGAEERRARIPQHGLAHGVRRRVGRLDEADQAVEARRRARRPARRDPPEARHARMGLERERRLPVREAEGADRERRAPAEEDRPARNPHRGAVRTAPCLPSKGPWRS